MEFLYHGVMLNEEGISGNKHSTRDNPCVDVMNTSLDFIESAKERLKYLENEGQCIEQNYRDYQYKIKSKYYPVNDDDQAEIRIVTQKKKQFESLDIEKFLESTLKANLNAQVLRADLEKEMAVHTKQQQQQIHEKSYHIEEIRKVEELINAVPIINKDRSFTSYQQEGQSIRNQILSDQNQLASLKTSFRNAMGSDRRGLSPEKIVLKKSQWDENSSTTTIDQKVNGQKNAPKLETLDDDR